MLLNNTVIKEPDKKNKMWEKLYCTYNRYICSLVNHLIYCQHKDDVIGFMSILLEEIARRIIVGEVYFESENSEKAFINRVVRNQCVLHIRKCKERFTDKNIDIENFEKTILLDEFSIYLSDLEKILSEIQYSIIIGYYILDKPLQEVADDLGISLTTVNREKAKALDKLREAFRTYL